MANLKIILFVALTTIGATFAKAPRGVFLGEVDGKLIYAEDLYELNWYGAEEYCELVGYGLLSIDFPAKLAFLRSHEEYLGSGQHYWTAAVDKMNYEQFKDMRTGAELEQLLDIVFTGPNCLAYVVGNGTLTKDMYVSESCDSRLNRLLCESLF